MDLTPISRNEFTSEPRFLHGFTPIASPPPELRPSRERTEQGPERRLAGWLYQGVPGLLGAAVLSWGVLLNSVTDHAHPVRMAAWTVLLFAAALAVGVLWRSLRAGRPLKTLAEWGDAHRSSLWVLGFAWGAAAFLVVPHMAQPAPVFAWFLVPLCGFAMALICASDARAATAVSLPPLLMTLLALSFQGMAMLPLALAVAGAGVLAAALLHAVHRLVRERAETAARLGPAPVLFPRS